MNMWEEHNIEDLEINDECDTSIKETSIDLENIILTDKISNLNDTIELDIEEINNASNS